jgi:hypothetical protein
VKPEFDRTLSDGSDRQATRSRAWESPDLMLVGRSEVDISLID